MMSVTINRRQLLAGTAGLAAIGIPSLSRPCSATEGVSDHGWRPGNRHLFLDDTGVERMDGLKRTVHQPTKHCGNPILHHDQRPWQEFRCQLYGTVLFDPADKIFRMWYLACARLPIDEPVIVDGHKRVPNFQFVAYAESTNGFDFDLPDLGLVDFNGSRANNLCRIGTECVEGIAVARDASPRGEDRYKALYWGHTPGGGGKTGHGDSGMFASVSEDGKRWREISATPVMPYDSDTGQQVLYDPALRKYVAYGRFGNVGRKVARSESGDFINWSTPQLVLEADTADGPAAAIYGMGVSLYEGLYVGLPWIFHDGTSGNIDVQLAVSHDGVRWKRVGDRGTFVRNGPAGSWDAGIIFTASQPLVVVDDRVFIYYSASLHNHHYRAGPMAGTPEWREYLETVKTSIGVATLRRDGFVSLAPTERVGTLLTKTFAMPAKGHLRVNVDAGDGEARVTLLKGDGSNAAPFARSTAVSGDRLDHVIEWTDSSRLPMPDTPVRLQFELNRARLYSYWYS